VTSDIRFLKTYTNPHTKVQKFTILKPEKNLKKFLKRVIKRLLLVSNKV